MSSFLVTGGAGFIGGAVARRLLRDGHRVVIIDNLSTGYREVVPVEAVFVEGGCEDPAVYAAIPQEHYDGIFHIAGQSSGAVSFDDPVHDLQTNTQSTLLILKFAARLGCEKVHYASSMSVYGDQPDEPVSEGNQTVPKSFYGVGKLASEHYLRILSDYGISTTALRLFNVYGPGQNLQNLRQGMVSIYLSQAIERRSIVVEGSPERYRDFVYISDVVDAFMAAHASIHAGALVCNIGTGTRTTVGALLEKLRENLPFEVPVEYSGTTPGDQHGIVADCALAAKTLGWRARIGLSDGLRDMTAWARQTTGSPGS